MKTLSISPIKPTSFGRDDIDKDDHRLPKILLWINPLESKNIVRITKRQNNLIQVTLGNGVELKSEYDSADVDWDIFQEHGFAIRYSFKFDTKLDRYVQFRCSLPSWNEPATPKPSLLYKRSEKSTWYPNAPPLLCSGAILRVNVAGQNSNISRIADITSEKPCTYDYYVGRGIGPIPIHSDICRGVSKTHLHIKYVGSKYKGYLKITDDSLYGTFRVLRLLGSKSKGCLHRVLHQNSVLMNQKFVELHLNQPFLNNGGLGVVTVSILLTPPKEPPLEVVQVKQLKVLPIVQPLMVIQMEPSKPSSPSEEPVEGALSVLADVSSLSPYEL